MTSTRWSFGPFTLDAAERTLRRDGVAVPIAPAGLELLRRFCEAGARPLTAAEIARGADPAAVRQAIARLRRALAPDVAVHTLDGGWSLGAAVREEIGSGPTRFSVRAGVVDVVSRRLVGHDGHAVSIPELETRLFARLARSPGITVSREQLLADVWGAAPGAVSRAVDTAVRRLRVRVEVDPSRPDHVIGARAAGYRFVPISALRVGDRIRPPLASLVERNEAVELTERLATRALVTLLGPPGVGKSTLARAWAAAHQGDYDQAWFVELAGADGVDAACARLAHAVDAGAGDPDLAVSRRLAGAGRALLVLDNTEHLAELGARVASWLARAYGLTVLATSRRPLGVAGEAIVRAEPLPGKDGVRLFQLRCEEAGVPAGPPEDVARLVDRLDGLPLAIELAAGRAELMRPAELLARLDDPLAGLRDTEPSTLERAVARSWDLADPDDRVLLARLSLFPGSFALADVALVAPDAEGRVARLARQSLLGVLRTETSTRYSMLATVRAYAARFREDDALLPDVVTRLLARGYPEPDDVPLIEVLLAWATGAPGRGAPRLLAALADATDATADPASLRWIPLAERVADPDEAVEVGLHAVALLRRRGRMPEAERRVLTTLGLPGGSAETQALLHTHAAYFALRRGNAVAARQAIARAEALHDGPAVAVTCRHLLSNLAVDEGDLTLAAAWMDAALAIPDAPPRQASRLVSAAVAVALERGDTDGARALLRRVGPPRGPREAATVAYYEGCLHLEEGRDDEALRTFERVVAISGPRATASQRLMVSAMSAVVLLRQGRPELAVTLLDATGFDDAEAEPVRRLEIAWLSALAHHALGDRTMAARRIAQAWALDASPSVQANLRAATRLIEGHPLDFEEGQLGRFLVHYSRIRDRAPSSR